MPSDQQENSDHHFQYLGVDSRIYYNGS